MSPCEKCWGDAYIRAQTMGGSQADHYRDLLATADHDKPTPCPAGTCVRQAGHDGPHRDGPVPA